MEKAAAQGYSALLRVHRLRRDTVIRAPQPPGGLAIRVSVLGSAAGGGLPQWNCSCPNCHAARQGIIPPRTQSSVAVSDGHGTWFLVNASPDLSSQIESIPELLPNPRSPRNSPLAGVFITNADLDHILGLFSLREGERLNIFAPLMVRSAIETSVGLSRVLDAFGGTLWHEAEEGTFTVCGNTSLEYRAIPLSGSPPPYAKELRGEGAHSVAYEFRDRKTNGRLVVAPDVAAVNDKLRAPLMAASAILFDGTFWSADELAGVKGAARSADEMGHLTIQSSMGILKDCPAQHKAYIHINNTNPVLMPNSKERIAVETAGIRIAEDGMKFEL